VTELVRILRRKEVERATGLRRASIYEQMDDGTFPRSVPIGPKSVGWLEPEIIDWQQKRIAQRDAQIAAPCRQRRRAKRHKAMMAMSKTRRSESRPSATGCDDRRAMGEAKAPQG